MGIVGLPAPSGLLLTRQEKPAPGTCVTVTLAGEGRGVQAAKRRLSEAARLGYRRAIVPTGSMDPTTRSSGTIVTDEGMHVMDTDAVWSALDVAFASRGPD